MRKLEQYNAENLKYLFSGDETYNSIPEYFGHLSNNMTFFDDPIYVGFTFHIDFANSPLFYNIEKVANLDRETVMPYLRELCKSRYLSSQKDNVPYFTNYDNVYYDMNNLNLYNGRTEPLSALEYLTVKLDTNLSSQNNNTPSQAPSMPSSDMLRADTTALERKERDASVAIQNDTDLGSREKRKKSRGKLLNAITDTRNASAEENTEIRTEMFTNYKTTDATMPKGDIAPKRLWQFIQFCKQMIDIQYNYPYILTDLEGLQTVWETFYKDDADAYTTKDDKVTLTLRESTDMQATSLIHNYRYSIVDTNNIRRTIPSNLLKFNCYVYVHQLKNFRNYYTSFGRMINNILGYDSLNPTSIADYQAPDKYINNYDKHSNIARYLALSHMGCIEFKFYGCEFLINDPSDIVNTISTKDPQINENVKLSFIYDNVDVNVISGAEILSLYLDAFNHPQHVFEILKSGDKIPPYNAYAEDLNNVVDEERNHFKPSYLGNAYEDYQNLWASFASLHTTGKAMVNKIKGSLKDIKNSFKF